MLVFVLATLAAFFLLAYLQAPLIAWTLAGGALTAYLGVIAGFGATTLWVLGALFVVAAALLNLAPLRRRLVSDPVLALFRRILPDMSATEKEAIDAGSVWWDGELFSGRPDWDQLLATPEPKLTPEEQAFLDGPCEEICALVNDWEVTHERYDLPPQVWQFLKDKGFLGMIIPKSYGGLGFSALAHSAVITKLSTRSNTLAVSAMVPNSLGPAELLLHYGTQAQKDYYLPRLARGQEVPCFALTSPEAGSDAASIPDHGVVCRGLWQGKEVLGMRVTWDKRYITLGPVATLVGLAFRLYDPEQLLGGKDDLGITCALVPAHTPGVEIGRRHLPLNAAFQNGPTRGKDVFMPIDWIIGGQEYAGKGWMMLMNCLAAGRSISLPASSAGGAKALTRYTGAYARVRSQFRTPIGRLEGVEEALGRIAANCYMMDAARILTAGALDAGERPSVISAIVKYHMTERIREIVNDAMDIHGGKGICLGPNNYVGRGYQVIPVGITVEGANILTRSLIIFGQGAIRCHPYVLREMRAAKELQGAQASREFDDAFTSHIGHTLSNGVRAFVHSLTGSRLAAVPRGAAPEMARYYQRVGHLSAAFAFLADMSMLAMGGALKRREKISARLGDVLSMMYLISATLKRYEDQGRAREDLPLIHWSVRDALWQAQQAIDAIYANFPVPALRALLRWIVFPFGTPFRPAKDRHNHRAARIALEPGAARDRLTAGMYLGKGETDITGALEAAFHATIDCEPVEKKLREAVKSGRLAARPGEDTAATARAQGVISDGELALWRRKEALRRRVIQVDDFPQDFGRAEALHRQAQEQVTAKAA
ncbi:MAG: acyl-CoA dehydrogenase [Betaproteobacteria bacterium]|nr:MAG: acyl-CoA dehydrogenase [Betaproteobacteria bacterium]